jgi:TRAP-type C4-dicarboxylate transport system permease small subunit
MERFLKSYERLLDRIAWLERVLGIFLLGLIVTCIFAQVVSRYFFRFPLVWVEEISTYAFIWIVFTGASLGLKRKRHIKILSFLGRLSEGKQRIFWGATDVIIVSFCLLLAANGVKAMAIFEWHQRTIALPVELPRFLFYSTPLILGTFSMAVTATHGFLKTLTMGRPGSRPNGG